MEEYLAEFVNAAKVNPPGAFTQLDILGAQLTLDEVLEADATMANNGTNAIEAFRAAMQYPGTELAGLQCCQYYAQAQLGLPRAYAMTGGTITAKKEYQKFFATWKTADPDLSQLVAAKKKFFGLQ
jgi:hypothetical protein